MLSVQTAVAKASLNRIPPLLSSVNVNNVAAKPSTSTLSNREALANATTKRRSHSMALAVNSPTEFFTSTIPSVTQRVKPIGFDEEPCTLGLQDGYSYARVEIGDRFGAQDRYEVVRKLGWGLYATTWLIKDRRDDAYHALKILNHYGTLLEAGEVDDPRRPRFFEREILARVSASDVAPGAKYCMKLLESFHIERETGKHLCLVMELGGMSVEDMRPLIGTNYSMPTAFVKTIVKQMCKALDYLHEECRVVHTDLKPSNILVTFSPKDTQELIDMTLKHRPVERYPPRRVLGETIRAMRSQPLPLPGFDQRNPLTWVFKLTDFGSAQWIGKRSATVVQPIRLRAPEVVLGHEWNEKIDIWSLGCLEGLCSEPKEVLIGGQRTICSQINSSCCH
ncbi:CMGC/SRPK protein kinase [Coprinopsis cinerea okayama7|uniref:CMGC/SRPK protein kinase n=1 Tax=Coprinopsis cinerea (strain Okayama-7 / 130 / ATCC MYA-4618 / FGSC 9003) TaxID=240176 RepID=A8NV52_COPC7|nr:CMGC/SRPK protein kinase [Coprinopsis cinerea okayama7\|eukprot:XP_001836601.2 CMGC/SRPK protein kinase [Coprinopsis cinerea okayama7\